MPNRCGWCSSHRLSEWEGRVAAGERIALVALDTPFSVDAARRHIRNHMQPLLRGQMLDPGASVTLADFADRLLELVDQAASIGQYAMQTHNPKLALSALQQERETLLLLIGRLGIEHGDAADVYRDAQGLARAVGRILRDGQVPGLAEELARILSIEGLDSMAIAVGAAGHLQDDTKGLDMHNQPNRIFDGASS